MASPLEQARNLALQNKAKNSDDQSSSGQEAAQTGLQKGSAELLKQAWLNLIPSWGLTLLYINIHLIASEVLKSNYFCKSGSEWTKFPEGKSETAERIVGMLEIITLLVLNCLVGLALLTLACFIYILVDALSNPLKTAWTAFAMAFGLIK